MISITKVYLLNTDFLNNDSLFEYCLSHVSAYRSEKIRRLQFRKGKNLCLGSGLLIDKGLSEFGLYEKESPLFFGENGKPYLAKQKNIFFNVSHSGNIAVCAFSDREVGIDIEKIVVADFKVSEIYFTEPEKNYMRQQSTFNLKNQAFFKIWTLKESFVKATGKGLSLPFHDFEITIDNVISVNQSLNDKKYFFKVYGIDDYIVSVCSESDSFSDITVICTKSLFPRF